MKKNKISRFLKFIYTKLFKINDTPHKIALGLGLGIFSGILPGTGPIAALFLSFLFKANRASALLGCLLTNTWLSFVILVFAIKLGSGILNVNWQNTYQNWLYFLENLCWSNLSKVPALEIILPVIIGYLLTGIILGILVYSVALLAITLERNRREKW